MRTKGAPHPTPARPVPKVEIIEREGQPTECKVTVNGVVVFDGVSREAQVQIHKPQVQELLPSMEIPLLFRGQEVAFRAINVSFDSNRGVTVVLQSGPLTDRVSSPITVSGV